MQATDANRFRDLLRGIGRVFCNEPDAVILDAYWLALSDWDLDEFEQACGYLLQSAQFMPRPSDFTKLRKASRPTAGEAWVKVLAYARLNGFAVWDSGPPSENNPNARPTDPVANQAVEAVGGYQAIAQSRTDQTHFIEKRFCEHYDAISDREDIRAAVPQLAGPTKHIGAVAQLMLTKTRAS